MVVRHMNKGKILSLITAVVSILVCGYSLLATYMVGMFSLVPSYTPERKQFNLFFWTIILVTFSVIFIASLLYFRFSKNSKNE